MGRAHTHESTHICTHRQTYTPPTPRHHSCSSRFSKYLDTKQASHPSSNNAYLLLGSSHRSLGKEELGLFKQLLAWRLLGLLKSAVFKAQRQSGRTDTQSRDRKRNCWVWGHRVPAAQDTWLFIFNGHFHPQASSKDVQLLNNWMHCGCARKEERGRGNQAMVTSLEVNSGTTTPNLPLSQLQHDTLANHKDYLLLGNLFDDACCHKQTWKALICASVYGVGRVDTQPPCNGMIFSLGTAGISS